MSRLVCAFTFDGAAVAKGRPRVTTRRGFAQTYTPKKTVDFELAVALTAKQAMNADGFMACDEAVGVTVVIHRMPPVYWPKKKRAAHMGQAITSGPDIDNQVKSILDGLNGVAYLDDCQVAALNAVRMWAPSDMFRVEVRTIEPVAS